MLLEWSRSSRGSWLALRGCTGEFGGSCDFSQVFFHQPASMIFCISGSLPLMWNCRLPSAEMKVNEPRAAAQ
ncbi:hypothetical protein Pelo_3566 [Pelomyxa schiedti]|nr:hypothetical protein Pelo_3566 [Pelomyxa schiedti]